MIHCWLSFESKLIELKITHSSALSDGLMRETEKLSFLCSLFRRESGGSELIGGDAKQVSAALFK